MKATVYYDANGEIQSVIRVDSKANVVPRSVHHSALEIDLKDVEVKTLLEVHSNFRVDPAHRTLIKCPEKKK